MRFQIPGDCTAGRTRNRYSIADRKVQRKVFHIARVVFQLQL